MKIGWKKINTLRKTSNIKRIKKIIKHALTTIAKKAVIGLQIPSYTSATQT
jgi:hypothetical protein